MPRLAAQRDAPGPRGLSRDAHLQRALAIARTQGAVFLELRASLTAQAFLGEGSALSDALTRLPEPEPWPDVMRARASLAR